MIVIGYQGIGKSTLSKLSNEYIDLESGNFWVDGKRAEDWYKPYCNIAIDLSSQGYIVFLSSHDVVRKYFIEENIDTKEQIIVIVPSFELKDQWIEKLEQRYNYSQLDKDYRAYMNAKDRYIENIYELCEDGKFLDGNLIIEDIDYDLELLIQSIKK
jgi:ABC-type proline/glycine betaine transport system ATPase subunit